MNIGHNGLPPLNLLFINGKGASGKDTQAERLMEGNPRASRISTGDAIRAIADNPDHPLYNEIKPQIDAANEQGKLLGDDVVQEIVNVAILDEIANGKDTLLFTGYPRTEGQLDALDGLLEDLQLAAQGEGRKTNVHFMQYDISDETSRERAAFRRAEHEATGIPVRKDDDPGVVEKRLHTYRESTQPMIDRLHAEGRLINIDASGSKDEVTELTREALGLTRSEIEGTITSVEDATQYQTPEEPLTPRRLQERR